MQATVSNYQSILQNPQNKLWLVLCKGTEKSGGEEGEYCVPCALLFKTLTDKFKGLSFHRQRWQGLISGDLIAANPTIPKKERSTAPMT